MLGETEGTSAGGAHEAGKKLRVPGTNPFWFEEESSMGNRFLELLGTCDLEVYLLNTGRIGGGDDDERSKKVSISTSAAVQDGIIDGSIEWITDPDFGYEVAASCPRHRRRRAAAAEPPLHPAGPRGRVRRRRVAAEDGPSCLPGRLLRSRPRESLAPRRAEPEHGDRGHAPRARRVRRGAGTLVTWLVAVGDAVSVGAGDR